MPWNGFNLSRHARIRWRRSTLIFTNMKNIEIWVLILVRPHTRCDSQSNHSTTTNNDFSALNKLRWLMLMENVRHGEPVLSYFWKWHNIFHPLGVPFHFRNGKHRCNSAQSKSIKELIRYCIWLYQFGLSRMRLYIVNRIHSYTPNRFIFDH